jgi:ABC-2 type transport system permease protein
MDFLIFHGTVFLTKLILRQNRLKLFLWLIGLIGITVGTASVYPGVYPDQESIMAYALTANNPSMVAMLGPGYALEDYNLGTAFAMDMLIFTAIVAGIMNILLVGRSTRADEEDGLTEVIRSLPIGRLSYLSATMIVMTTINVLLALFTGLGLYSLGIVSFDLESSLLYGSILGATGLIFAAFTALFAQLFQTSRGATGFSFAILIGSYLVRAIGDVSNEMLSLISPLGWLVRTEVFVADKWWPIVVTGLVSIVLILLAFYLNGIRDLDSGFIPERKGKDKASAFLQTPFGLAFRLQRTNIISWAIALFLLSAVFGTILGDLETYFADNDMVQAFLPKDSDFSLSQQFLTMLVAIMSLIGTIPAVMTITKLRSEENKNRTEHFYSRSVSRTSVLGVYSILALLVSMAMQFFIAIGLWSGAETVLEDGLNLGETFISVFVYLPGMLIVISIATLLIGCLPKLSSFVWSYVIYCFIIVYLGGILDLPQWMRNLSSFEHIPQLPVEDMNDSAIISLMVISTVLTVIGFISYKRRDITG